MWAICACITLWVCERECFFIRRVGEEDGLASTHSVKACLHHRASCRHRQGLPRGPVHWLPDGRRRRYVEYVIAIVGITYSSTVLRCRACCHALRLIESCSGFVDVEVAAISPSQTSSRIWNKRHARSRPLQGKRQTNATERYSREAKQKYNCAKLLWTGASNGPVARLRAEGWMRK